MKTHAPPLVRGFTVLVALGASLAYIAALAAPPDPAGNQFANNALSAPQDTGQILASYNTALPADTSQLAGLLVQSIGFTENNGVTTADTGQATLTVTGAPADTSQNNGIANVSPPVDVTNGVNDTGQATFVINGEAGRDVGVINQQFAGANTGQHVALQNYANTIYVNGDFEANINTDNTAGNSLINAATATYTENAKANARALDTSPPAVALASNSNANNSSSTSDIQVNTGANQTNDSEGGVGGFGHDSAGFATSAASASPPFATS